MTEAQRYCLILGYGRAGKRHAKSAREQGLKVTTFDPFVDDADYHELNEIPWFAVDYAVIASPPDQHLAQITTLLDNGVTNILCEKPLCSWSENGFMQLPEKLPVMLAYNWLYNDQVRSLRYSAKSYNMFCEQSRVLPAWGIENDHLPHDLFIINYISGGITEIKWSSLVKSKLHQEITVEGKTRMGDFTITERVLVQPTERISRINGVDLVPDTNMFDRMWAAFMRKEYKPSLKDGLVVQKWLYHIYDRMQEHEVR